MELKTLKDIITDELIREALKFEAIKWVKGWFEELENPKIYEPEWKTWICSRVDVFTEFLNITEDDFEPLLSSRIFFRMKNTIAVLIHFCFQNQTHIVF